MSAQILLENLIKYGCYYGAAGFTGLALWLILTMRIPPAKPQNKYKFPKK